MELPGGARTGNDALHRAANRGQLETVKLLLEASARPEAIERPTGHQGIDALLRRRT